jgi:hypothetical protein
VRPPLCSSGQSSWLQIQRFGFDYRRYQIFWEAVGLSHYALASVACCCIVIGSLPAFHISSRRQQKREVRNPEEVPLPHSSLLLPCWSEDEITEFHFVFKYFPLHFCFLPSSRINIKLSRGCWVGKNVRSRRTEGNWKQCWEELRTIAASPTSPYRSARPSLQYTPWTLWYMAPQQVRK